MRGLTGQAIAIVIRSGHQLMLADDANRFFKKVEFDAPESDDVRRIRPAGPASPVVIDPLVRFGRPSVQGTATERLWELFDAGESVAEIAAGYDMAEELPSPTPGSARSSWQSPRCERSNDPSTTPTRCSDRLRRLGRTHVRLASTPDAGVRSVTDRAAPCR